MERGFLLYCLCQFHNSVSPKIVNNNDLIYYIFTDILESEERETERIKLMILKVYIYYYYYIFIVNKSIIYQ